MVRLLRLSQHSWLLHGTVRQYIHREDTVQDPVCNFASLGHVSGFQAAASIHLLPSLLHGG